MLFVSRNGMASELSDHKRTTKEKSEGNITVGEKESLAEKERAQQRKTARKERRINELFHPILNVSLNHECADPKDKMMSSEKVV